MKTVFVVFVFLAASFVASAEYYKYTDENGTVRYTDDMSQIPESRSDAIEKFESESDDTKISEILLNSSKLPSASANNGDSVQLERAETVPGTFTARAEELNQIQAGLNKAREELEKDREALNSHSPGDNATAAEKQDYADQVESLNARIKQYGEDLKAFEEKADALNSQYRSIDK